MAASEPLSPAERTGLRAEHTVGDRDTCHLCRERRPCRMVRALDQLAGTEADLLDMVWQFAYRGKRDGQRVLHSGGLSALEDAFAGLGWADPHAVTEGGCEWPGCADWATAGSPTPAGYRRLCHTHYDAAQAARTTEGHDG